ncbi:hypothetical protein BFP97_16700 [Roseivirga sp. 4D4]|uniref:SHOCT domain-containing protein n=1 Tax=Roseivirga sp. 4D4 TaxID=1889784 RepID=UPI000852A429|nr:SHOCT domain-containing protein [Roseivirga sp. 4D4]OEK03059.1 hypothetical protein BFP97_16700 [Roseivirga sp. 4D4]
MHWGYSFWGMHLVWWIVWIVLLIWIFVTPWDVPGQRKQPDSPLDILKKRYASGEIGQEQFERMKEDLEKQ